MTTTKLDQHEEALAEHINAVRGLREALAEVDRLAKITDEMCDTIHGLESKLVVAPDKPCLDPDGCISGDGPCRNCWENTTGVDADTGDPIPGREIEVLTDRINRLNNAYTAAVARAEAAEAKLARVLEMLEPGDKPKEPYPSVTSYEHQSASIKRKLWLQHECFYRHAVAIAEGRDDE